MSGYIYKLFHKNYYYIGQTKLDIEQRANQHWYNRQRNYKLYNYMRNTNREDWTIEELEIVPIHLLNTREAFYINLKDPFCLNTNYNYRYIK